MQILMQGEPLGLSMSTTRRNDKSCFRDILRLRILEILKDIGIPISQIIAIGGGSKSPLWKQILADIFGYPIQEINTNQGGALGAAILAGVGTGEYKSIEEACNKFIKIIGSTSPKDKNIESYNKLHKLYREAYKSLKNWFKLSADL